jgi:hypothetical protein
VTNESRARCVWLIMLRFFHHPILASACTFAFGAILAGCNADSIDRAAVSGKVTLDGQPIFEGQIRFIPENGPMWAAWIKDGRYTTEGAKGVPVGNLLVRIEAYRIPAWHTKAGSGAVAEGDETPREQYLPSKYNRHSELKMTIEPGSGRVEKDFALST